MRRRFFALCCSLIFLFLISAPIDGAEERAVINFDTPICLKVNDTYIKLDAEPFLHQGTTFVPIRFVSEAIGADSVTWDAKNNKANIILESKNIELTAGSNYAYVNGQKVKTEQSVKLVKDRTYVPVRFVSENLGCDVNWDGKSYTVNIYKSGVNVPSYLVGNRGYSDDEIYWLSKIINAESAGEPMKGKIAVGNVVLNRVESSLFPNTIYGVIFDRNYGVQFSPVLDGSIYKTPLGDSVIAAKRALRGETEAGRSLYFLNPKKATSNWIINNRIFHKTIANHDFYL